MNLPDPSNWPFSTVLVANRGEIAVRVLRTVQALGLKGVVVYHAADRGTLAVQMADAAIEISGSTPVAAYLDTTQILAAAKASGAGAIHPGYGFLSENKTFCAAVEAAGLRFIGPTPEQIDLMGDKVRARNAVEKGGFPVAPSAIEDDDPATFVERARAVGAPLLIKPSAGGGGKGMRIVRDLSLLETEVERARSRASATLVTAACTPSATSKTPATSKSRCWATARATWCTCSSANARCSGASRKSSKKPSPALDDAQRRDICETAAGIARAIDYRNAGTVEFIFGQQGEFFFSK